MSKSQLRKQRSKSEIDIEFNDILASLDGEPCGSHRAYPAYGEIEILDTSLFSGMDEHVDDESVEDLLLSLKEFSTNEGIEVDAKENEAFHEDMQNLETRHSFVHNEFETVKEHYDNDNVPGCSKSYNNNNSNNDHIPVSIHNNNNDDIPCCSKSNNNNNDIPGSSKITSYLVNDSTFISEKIFSCNNYDRNSYYNSTNSSNIENNKNENNDNENINNINDNNHNTTTITTTTAATTTNNNNDDTTTTTTKFEDNVLCSITSFNFDLNTLIETTDSEKYNDVPQGTKTIKPLKDVLECGDSLNSIVLQQSSISCSSNDDGDSESDVVLKFNVSSPYIMTTSDLKGRLQALQSEIGSTDEEKDEATKIKERKIKEALEKMVEKSFEKLFIKVYHKDHRMYHVMMIDKAWTARDLINSMILKTPNPVDASRDWCIVEKIPQFSIERILEDSESIMETVLDWSSDADNMLLFTKEEEKHKMFNDPQRFLPIHHADAHCTKDGMLKDFFANYIHSPNFEGTLWLQTGFKKWTKLFFTLRPSGIYYNSKGKKSSLKMLCLATYDSVCVYTGLEFHKKFKSPTNHVFCLKPSSNPDVKPSDLRVLCAEDRDLKIRWMCSIRLAKYGSTLYQDYVKTREDEARRKRGWSTSSKRR